MSRDNIKIKKVRAYPFAVQFKSAIGTFSGQVVKLTDRGFLAETSNSSLQPGEKFECSFELPVLHSLVSEPVVTIKFYQQWSGSINSGSGLQATAGEKSSVPAAPGAPAAIHLVEMHFLSLSPNGRKNVLNFLTQLTKKVS